MREREFRIERFWLKIKDISNKYLFRQPEEQDGWQNQMEDRSPVRAQVGKNWNARLYENQKVTITNLLLKESDQLAQKTIDRLSVC